MNSLLTSCSVGFARLLSRKSVWIDGRFMDRKNIPPIHLTPGPPPVGSPPLSANEPSPARSSVQYLHTGFSFEELLFAGMLVSFSNSLSAPNGHQTAAVGVY